MKTLVAVVVGFLAVAMHAEPAVAAQGLASAIAPDPRCNAFDDARLAQTGSRPSDISTPTRESLRAFLDRGGIPTAAGLAVLNGAPLAGEPGAKAPFASTIGDVILAYGAQRQNAEGRASGRRAPMGRAAPSRATGTSWVFLDCAFDITGHVNYENGYGFAWVTWHRETNPLGGPMDTVDGPSNFCPTPNNNCFHYAWQDPPANRGIFDAEVYADWGPFGAWGYCGGGQGTG